MKSEHNWCCPMMWDTTEPLPMGKEGDSIVIMDSPWGPVTLRFEHGRWFWAGEIPKCMYGINPCPHLKKMFSITMPPVINAWIEKHKEVL